MVMPRKTSSETRRLARLSLIDAGAPETGSAMVSTMAMRVSSAGGDSTADKGMPQCQRGFGKFHEKNDRKGDPAILSLEGRNFFTAQPFAGDQCTLKLCAPQKSELTRLALCGTHHVWRRKPCLLYIIFLAVKSISAGAI